MSLKRKTKVTEVFSMASMTDVIFLLLIFFMVTSTLIVPNALRVSLPSANKQPAPEAPLARITISEDMRYFAAFGRDKGHEVAFEEILPLLLQEQSCNPEMYVAIYADENVPYREIVKVLSMAGENKMKVVLATKAQSKK